MIYHVTSPASAVSIVLNGTFYPVSSSPLNLDSGLNCFSKLGKYKRSQCFSGDGAEIHFIWSGNSCVLSTQTAPPLPTGLLIDQAPWRLHIRGPVGPTDLRVFCVRFRSSYEDCLELPSWLWLMPALLRRKIIRRFKLQFLRSLRRFYRDSACYVQVGC